MMLDFKFVSSHHFVKTIYLTLIMIPSLIYAQETDPKMNVNTLNFLEGNWKVENWSFANDSGWQQIGETKSEIITEHNSKFIHEDVRYLTTFGEINMITFIGFDSRINKYKLCAMDKEYGLMDIYNGTWTEGDLIFTNLNSDKPVTMDDGKELHFRLTYQDITDAQFTHLVEGSFDKGNNWFVFSKSIYYRMPE